MELSSSPLGDHNWKIPAQIGLIWREQVIVPKDDDDQDVYIVVDDFGRNGRCYRETDVENTDRETVIVDLLDGQYKNPGGRLQHR
jgi:hypothetical protein